MQKEIRTVCYDDDLHLEAYRFEGIAQPFPNHFHDFYVIGFIEAGTRCLSCKNKEYTVGQGNILLFHPNDNHSCVQCDGGTLDSRNYIPEYSKEIEKTCTFMAEHITLDNLCKCSGLSNSTLLRAVTKSKGVTPYRYLQTVRIGKAKELLEQGVTAASAAIQTGFSDQSHFSNFLHMFIGLSPAAYKRIFKGGGRNHG